MTTMKTTAISTGAERPVPELRPARGNELPQLERMLEDARERLRALGLTQWQSGYPNLETLAADVAAQRMLVLARDDGALLAAGALCFGEDESYREIDGSWLSDAPYATVHRLFTARDTLRCGCARRWLCAAETLCLSHGVHSLRADTHRGNAPMRALLERGGFRLCGVIRLCSSPEPDPERLAYQKIL